MKKITSVLVFVLVCTSVASLSFYAKDTKSDDNISFSFNVPKNQGNGYTGTRYRQTLDSHNPWKVNLTYSGEGKGTVSTFWLELRNGKNVSQAHNVAQGSGSHKYPAYRTASEENVRLTAQNNQNNSNHYTVSGYWDEETW